jgi:leucyl-tRNA synthetase
MVVFGMGLLEGNKMSSSKGNVILLSDAIEKYGADVVRLFLMASAEPWQDFDWREKEVIGTKRRLDRLFEFAKTIEDVKGSPLDLNNIKEVELSRKIDLWMINQLNIRIKGTTEALEGFQTRNALQNSLFLLKKDIDHYTYRVKHLLESDEPDEAIVYVLSNVFKSWIRILAPFIPHSSEELWSSYGGKGFVVEAPWPEDNIYFGDESRSDLNLDDKNLASEIIEKSEEMVQGIVHDIQQIKKRVAKDPEKVHIYLADDWKWDLYEIADEVGKPDIGQIMGKAIGQNIHDDKKEIAMFAKRISREMTKTRYIGKINENEILKDGKDFIEEEVGTEIVIHQDDAYDPEDKAKNAIPYKPAIYME